MELRNHHTTHSPETALAALKDPRTARRASELPALQPYHLAIKAKFGPSDAVKRAFGSEMVLAVGQAWESALKRPAPSLVCMARAYSPELMHAVVLNMVNATLAALGEESRVDAHDRAHIARALCSNVRFRTLTMDSVMQFFYRLQTGMIEAEGWLRPALFLRLANRWAQKAHEEEKRIGDLARAEREAREREEHARSAISFAEHKARMGLPADMTLQEWMHTDLSQARREKEEGGCERLK